MGDDPSTQKILVELRVQLEQSRQQEERLKAALTSMLSLIDDLEKP